MKRFFRAVLFIVLALVLIVLLVVGGVLAFLSPITLRLANRYLPEIIGTSATLEDVNISLRRGSLSLSGLRIGQPMGYDAGPLADLKSFAVRIDTASLSSDTIVVDAVVLDGLSLIVIKDTNGIMNVARLGPPKDGSSEPASEPAPPAASKPDRKPSETPTCILVRQVDVRNVAVTYTDLNEAKPLSIALDPISLSLTNLVIAPEGLSPDLPAHAQAVIEARIAQSPFTNAYLLAAAEVGPVAAGVPDVNAVLRLVGFELTTVGPLVPPGVSQALGGAALDLRANLALSSALLDCQAVVHTVSGHNLGLYVGGTIDKPDIDKSGILFGVVGRLGGGVGNVVGNVGEAGLSVVSGAGQAVGSVAGGAGDAVKSVGKGLLQTVKGVATADLSEVGAGLKQGTVGTVREATGAVADAGGDLVGGARDAGGAALGGERAQRWRTAIPERWRKERAEALALLERMPFPPVRLKDGPAWDAKAAEGDSWDDDLQAPVPMRNDKSQN